ncbi:lateral signaling target protein 2 homolog [Acropora millepora]|uniref:lateral signaling target protein 2 homolog n=1 Tax=Acropora millepora TaxID=45264 RepID=UPI001CF44809|nr:lateral signaling target protein 2 homolog [Acropora millepora]XP_044163705.1 lateral signaling target protein 2 homolog [Acropora millepora]
MAEANNIDMPSANEDVLLRSDGPTPTVQHSQQSETNTTAQFLRSLVQQPQPTTTNATTKENRTARQLRLTRRERDYRTRSHRDQLSTTQYRSTRFHHSSSSTSHRHSYHRRHQHHRSTSRDRSYERTRRLETRKRCYKCGQVGHIKKDCKNKYRKRTQRNINQYIINGPCYLYQR